MDVLGPWNRRRLPSIGSGSATWMPGGRSCSSRPRHDGRLRSRVTYLDAFAGPGRYEGGEEGSPVFALRRLLDHDAADRMQLRRDRVRLLFTEKSRSRYQYLQAELGREFGPLEELPVWVEPFQAEAGRDAESLLEKAGAWGHPILATGSSRVPSRRILMACSFRSSSRTWQAGCLSRRAAVRPRRLPWLMAGSASWSGTALAPRPYISISAWSRASACDAASAWA